MTGSLDRAGYRDGAPAPAPRKTRGWGAASRVRSGQRGATFLLTLRGRGCSRPEGGQAAWTGRVTRLRRDTAALTGAARGAPGTACPEHETHVPKAKCEFLWRFFFWFLVTSDLHNTKSSRVTSDVIQDNRASVTSKMHVLNDGGSRA